MVIKALSEINEYVGTTVNPLTTPGKTFELYSVPSYENHTPEIIQGKEIGSTKITVEENDVLICKINPRINRVWVVKHTTPYVLLASSEWIVVRNHQMNPHYLMRYFSSDVFRKLMNAHVAGIGGSLTRAQPKQVAKYPVPVVSQDEQDQIAATLDRLDTLINKRKQQLEKLDLLVKSRFVEMFGDVESNSMGWKCEAIDTVIKSITAGWSANGEAREKKPGEKAVLKVSAVTQGFFKPEEYKVIPATTAIKKYVYPQQGDLLFSRANTRELVGATAIISKDYPDLLLPDKLWKVLFTPEVDVVYAKHILSTKSIRHEFSAQSTGTSGSMFNVSAEKFRSIHIPIPPIAEQKQFAAFVSRVDKSKAAVQKSLDQLEMLKKALMQKYFG